LRGIDGESDPFLDFLLFLDRPSRFLAGPGDGGGLGKPDVGEVLVSWALLDSLTTYTKM